MPLVEVLGTSRSHATPGWAYVPDTRGPLHSGNKSSTAAGRKRGIREPGGRTDLTSRQNHAIIRHLAELDRENHRDNVHVPVPVRKDAVQRDNGRAARAKTTSNVRRIMQSQKTFKNYLDDEEAAMAHQLSAGGANVAGGLAAAAAAGPASSKIAKFAATRSATPIPKQEVLSDRQKRAMARKSTTTTTPSTSKTATKGKQKWKKAATAESTAESTTEKPDAAETKEEETEEGQPQEKGDDDDDNAMQTDPPEQPIAIKGLIKTPYDNEHLLKSYLPNPPSDTLMAALLAEPPLRYHTARAGQSTSGKPGRSFCTICGYWGKIKCRNCGVRTCGLECYKVHEDSRCGAFF